MARVFFFIALALMASAAYSAPAEDQASYEEVQPDALIPQARLPRATCDLLSGFGVGDSACAVHCIARRFRGGWCDKGVCHCRH